MINQINKLTDERDSDKKQSELQYLKSKNTAPEHNQSLEFSQLGGMDEF